jgi:hypothetical protein
LSSKFPLTIESRRLVIIPDDASDRVKLIEGLRVMSPYSREPIPTRRVYVLASNGCS